MQAWGANALVGHIMMLVWGMFLSAIDIYYISFLPDFGRLAALAAFVLFPPLLLAAKGRDTVNEKVQSFFLTFITSSVFGIFAGSMINPIWMSWLGWWKGELDFSFSVAWALFAAIAVSWSYWSMGQMSRVYLRDLMAQFGSCPEHTGRLIACLDTLGQQDLGRELLEGLLEYRFPSLMLEAGSDSVMSKIKTTLEDLAGKNDVQKTVWVALVEEADKEVADWTNTFGGSSVRRAKTKTGGV